MAAISKQKSGGGEPRPSAMTVREPRLPYHPQIADRFGIDKASWIALVDAVFPNASSVNSVILALSYCRARGLDPFKRNVHIVPIYSKDQQCMVDTIWPGIGELRTTAVRTGVYAGRARTEFGPDVTQTVGAVEITFPEWAAVTVYRIVQGIKVEFNGPQVYWLETYATRSRNDKSPNEMWSTRPRGQIDKCAEAAALRAAFPEEIGGDFIPEEVQHDRTVAGEAKEVTESRSESLLRRIGGTNNDEDAQPAEAPEEVASEPEANVEPGPM